MRDESRELLASLWNAKDGDKFEVEDVRRAFTDAGASVSAERTALVVEFSGQTGYLFYISDTNKTFVGRPCGVGMYNMRRLLMGS